MTPRRRWWFRFAGASIVWLVFAIVFAIVGQWSAAIVSVGAACVVILSTRSSIWLYRSGYWTGRASQLVELDRSVRGLPTPTPRTVQPNPWDTFPAWPADDEPADSEPGHNPENAV